MNNVNTQIFDISVLKPLQNKELDISKVSSDIQINNICLEKDNKPWYVVSGEFQYSRYDSARWEEEILKIKTCGVNTIATYAFWNHHEYEKGCWNFSGDMDVRKFIELCKKHNMYVILRIGPFCHGEVVYGGFPKYVARYPKKRSNDAKYLGWVKELYKRYYDQVKDFLYPNGTVFAIQLENEFTGKLAHIKRLKEIAVEVGFLVPIYTVTSWSGELVRGEVLPLSGQYPEAPWAQSLKPLPYDDRFRIVPLHADSVIGNDTNVVGSLTNEDSIFDLTPLGMCELGAGVQATKHRRPIISTKDAYSLSMVSIAKGINILGYYIFHGGRNPNFAPMQETRRTLYPNNLPMLNYDFQAPLDEYGYPREKYHYLKLLHYFCTTFDNKFPQMQAVFDSQKTKGYSSAVRINEQGEGYHFISTYERRISDNGVGNLRAKIKMQNNTIELPPISLPNGESFFYPFNLKIGDRVFDYITAQPILKYENKNKTTYIFAKHKDIDICCKYTINGEVFEQQFDNKEKAEIHFEAENQKYSLYFIEFSEALKLYYCQSQNKVVYSESFVYFENGKTVEMIKETADKEGIKLIKAPKKKMKYDTFFYGIYKPQNFLLTVDKNLLNENDDIEIEFDFLGDMLHVYADEKLVADYILVDGKCRLCLSRIKNELQNGKRIEIRTSAVKPRQRTYYELCPTSKNSDLSIKQIYTIKKQYK